MKYSFGKFLIQLLLLMFSGVSASEVDLIDSELTYHLPEDCGLSWTANEDPTQIVDPISGYLTAQYGLFPSFVYFHYINCPGALITDDMILVLASCFLDTEMALDVNFYLSYISYGTTNWIDVKTNVSISHICPGSDIREIDFLMVRADRKIDFRHSKRRATPICLPDKALSEFPDDEVMIVNYMSKAVYNYKPPLQYIKAKYVDSMEPSPTKLAYELEPLNGNSDFNKTYYVNNVCSKHKGSLVIGYRNGKQYLYGLTENTQFHKTKCGRNIRVSDTGNLARDFRTMYDECIKWMISRDEL